MGKGRNSTVVSFRFPDELLVMVDGRAHKLGVDRNRYVKSVLERELSSNRDNITVSEPVGVRRKILAIIRIIAGG